MNSSHAPPLFLNGKYYFNFSFNEIIQINQAYMYAYTAHYGQERSDGSAYIYHPIRIVEIVIGELYVYDAELVIACLLHDVEENSNLPYISETIRLWFGLKNEYNARKLTKTPENKKVYLKEIIESGDWRIILAKLVDRLDNMQTLEGGSKAFQEKQAKETRELFLNLCLELEKVIPQKHKNVPTIIHARLTKLCEQYGC